MPSRTPYTSTALEVLTSANLEKGPKGLIAYAYSETTTANVNSESDLTDLSVTVTIGSSRIIKIRGYCSRVSSDTSDDLANFRIKESTTQLAESRVDTGSNAAGNGGTLATVETKPFSPSAGSHTYKLTGSLAAGTGDLDFRASSTAPSVIEVWDLGPAF